METGSFDERTERNISTLLPEAQKAARQWFKLARNEAVNQGYEAKIICGTRTYAEQNDLYRQRPKVTNARGGQSWHNFGLAWDFGIFQDRNYLPNHPLYTTLGKLYAKLTAWSGEEHGNPLQIRRICSSINSEAFPKRAEVSKHDLSSPMTQTAVTTSVVLANTLAVVCMATSELNPLLEYVQNGASVAAVMGIFLWREMKRAERYEKLYDQERRQRITAERKCSSCMFMKLAHEQFAGIHSQKGNAPSPENHRRSLTTGQ